MQLDVVQFFERVSVFLFFNVFCPFFLQRIEKWDQGKRFILLLLVM